MSDDFDADLIVRRIIPITHDVTSFALQRPAGWSGCYNAGQHLVISQHVDGVEVERCYTIASPPTRSELLTITVKRQPGGVLSPWLHASLQPGDRLRARGPYGEFTTCAHPARRTPAHRAGGYLFLSAGSGITPAMSMVRAFADAGSEADVAFVHNARTPVDIIFRRELTALSETGLNVRVTVVCEEDRPADRWDGPLGRLNVELLRWAVPDAAEREIFLCGPPAYMTATTGLLETLGADPDRIHRESFTVGGGAELFGVASDPASVRTGARIELKRSGTVVVCPDDSTVLDAVLGAGVMLRSSCRQGLCGTCKLTLVSGEVDMRHQGGIRQREIDRGLFLPCCSRPLTDLVLDS